MLSARPVDGRFRSLRSIVNAVLVAILFAVPWVRIDGEPLVLLDIAARRFHVAGLVIFPQELYLLWLLVIGLAIALFFFTTLAGRLWCGWACPQTVFTDVFAGIARRVEGWKGFTRPKRVAPWRRVALHAVWLAACIAIGFHLVGYFHSPYAMLHEIRTGSLSSMTVGLWTVATAVAYADFVFVRQTFCKYLCPYARFQGVMFDRDTLVVGYDTRRGEPRGKRAQGDCVDCGLCVAVCPTGIDIRDGLQLECITCTQCIDECDGVMAKLGRAPSLIGYRALASLEGQRPARLLRPRVLVYAAMLAAIVVGFGAALAQREPLDLQVIRNRAELFQTAADGRASNAFTLHIQNRARMPRSFVVALEGSPGFELVAGMNPVSVDATDEVETRVFVLAPLGSDVGADGREIRFTIEATDDARARVERPARFLARRSTG